MAKTTSGWKKNIPLEDFIIGGEHNIPLEPSPSKPLEYKRIAAIVKMTFAGTPTGNAAIYLPDEMFAGTRSWTIPYERPIQTHHNDKVDPIGRVKDARYVDTSLNAIEKFPLLAKAMRVFHDPKATLLDRLQTTKIFQMADKAIENFEGVGYIEGLWDVSDPEAVKKVVDKRYLTVSTAFSPKGAYCSSCANEGQITDWRSDECEHERGEYYDGFRCVAIPYGFNYDEVSPVNTPAARNAVIIEVGDNLSFADAVANSTITKRSKIGVVDFIGETSESFIRFSDSQTCNFPTSFKDFFGENKPKNETNVIETNIKGKPEESNMNKLSRLLKDSKLLNEEISKHLPEGYTRLSDEDIGKLEDSSFVGPKRTLLVTDLVMADAVKALLESCEDSESKTALLEGLESKRAALQPKAEDTAPQSEVESLPEVPGEKDEQAPEAPVDDSSVKLKDLELKLADSMEKLEELEMEKAVLKKRLEDTQKDYKGLLATNESMTKKLRDNLVEKLLDAKVARGLKFQDRKAELNKYSDRSLSSIEDSIKEISDIPERTQGLSTSVIQPEPHPSDKEADANDSLEKYTDVYQRYMDIRYSRGEVAADKFLDLQRKQGIIPASTKF